jgi:hypothetical protein
MAAPQVYDSVATTIIAATSTAGTAPTSGTDGFKTGLDTVRTFFDYTGTVTACVVRLYIRDRAGAWYRAASTTDGDPLTGTDEVRDWLVGDGTEFTFVVESISGGGTVAVSAIVGQQ